MNMTCRPGWTLVLALCACTEFPDQGADATIPPPDMANAVDAARSDGPAVDPDSAGPDPDSMPPDAAADARPDTRDAAPDARDSLPDAQDALTDAADVLPDVVDALLDMPEADVQEPDVQEPDVQEPDVQEPDVQEPDVQEPDTGGPNEPPVVESLTGPPRVLGGAVAQYEVVASDPDDEPIEFEWRFDSGEAEGPVDMRGGVRRAERVHRPLRPLRQRLRREPVLSRRRVSGGLPGTAAGMLPRVHRCGHEPVTLRRVRAALRPRQRDQRV